MIKEFISLILDQMERIRKIKIETRKWGKNKEKNNQKNKYGIREEREREKIEITKLRRDEPRKENSLRKEKKREKKIGNED